MFHSEERLRRYLLVVGLGCNAIVFVLFRLFERPGLGIAHLYYVAIVLVAVNGGALLGVGAGGLATALYAVDVYWNPRIPVSSLPTVSMGIRLFSFVLVGSLIGYYASRSRNLLAKSDALAAELKVLSLRDFATGLPNQRAFQSLIAHRIERGERFTLVLCQVPPPPSSVALIDWLLGVRERLMRAMTPDTDIARISDHQFAVLAPANHESGPAANRLVEDALRGIGAPAAGWAEFPADGRDALGLFSVAGDRLFVRSMAAGYEHPKPVLQSTTG